jgi:MoxR-like ATPase
MRYRKQFDPASTVMLPRRRRRVTDGGDARDGAVYVYTDRIVLAVNVALATNRPLLLRGLPGSGKSSLAHNVARVLGRRYYEAVITSRTQARDLLWTFDALRRLRDAQAGERDMPLATYLEPGPLWWAFDPETARRRGGGDDPRVPDALPPGPGGRRAGSVVLLDEIDKADPDTPNNLLVPLGSLEFVVSDLNLPVYARRPPPLVFITTNEERDLPQAFLRRCVTLEIDPPDEDRLVDIARAHFGPEGEPGYRAIARLICLDGGPTSDDPPNTAEFLDAVRASHELNIAVDPNNALWQNVESITLRKSKGLKSGRGK